MVGIIARDLATPVETVALLAAAFALPYAFIQPILGPIGDALGKERVMKVCLALLALALVGSALAPDIDDALFALRIVAGAAAGGVIPLALALIGDRVEMAQRQVAISRLLDRGDHRPARRLVARRDPGGLHRLARRLRASRPA